MFDTPQYLVDDGLESGNANLGVWAKSPEAYVWLAGTLTPERLKQLLPECRGFAVERYLVPNILALNFVIKGLLGDGVSSSARSHPPGEVAGQVPARQVVEVPPTLVE